MSGPWYMGLALYAFEMSLARKNFGEIIVAFIVYVLTKIVTIWLRYTFNLG
jgi:hypothetical protein